MKNRIKTLLIFTLVALALLLGGTKVFAEGEDDNFKPSGAPFVKVFFNAHTSLSDFGKSGFELDRAYLGYAYNLSDKFSLFMNLDVGAAKVAVNDSTSVNTSLNYTAYLKNAYMNYSSDRFSFSAGMIGTKNFKLQEKYWGHRYVSKSFQDENKIAPSADLGMAAEYTITDGLAVDLTLRNGEGYKKVQSDGIYHSGIGLSMTYIEGFVLRAYYDVSSHALPRSVFSGFAGYQKGGLSLGSEYNIVLNDDETLHQNLSGLSAYISYDLTEKLEWFGRVDHLESSILGESTTPWNVENDGEVYYTGIQYTPIKGVVSSLNIRFFNPSLTGAQLKSYLYLNFEYSFK